MPEAALAALVAHQARTEISRRLALSLAITGDRRGSDTVLSALLQKQDRAAWRARIFALAILGYEEEAVATAKATMPPDLAVQIAPYLRYMRRLTPAQQAAAANLGIFPQSAQIGQDDPRITQYARALDRSLAGAGVGGGLVPAGRPLGLAATGQPAAAPPGKRRKDKSADRFAPGVPGADGAARNSAPPPDLLVSREIQPADPGLLTATLPIAPAPPSLPTAAAPAAHHQLPPALPGPAARPPAPAVILPSAPVPVYGPRPGAATPAARPSFADAFAAVPPVVIDITPERGAVDLQRIAPARVMPKTPAPPSHPSRVWVELGVGRDIGRIGFDWHRMVRDDPALFKGRTAWISSWARTNRLLVGPFESDTAAGSFAERLHRAGHGSAFVWTSPAGQVVDALEPS